MKKQIVATGIIGGVVITLFTGLIPNVMLMGATHYGYPFAWLIRMVFAPQYFPWRVNIFHLIGDLIIWGIISGIISYIVLKFKK